MISNIDTILAILGVLVSLILGYLGLKYTLKFRKKPNLIFIKNNSISLFERLVKNLDDLEIKFKGEKVNENLILFQGTFFNYGNIDFDKSTVYKPIEIELPKGYKWVQFKIIEKSKGLNIEIDDDSNRLIFKWDLLKEGEFFIFDSIIKYESDKNEDEVKKSNKIEEHLLDGIIINHRIKDLKNIGIEKSFPETISNYMLLLFASLNLLLILYAANLASVPIFSSDSNIFQEITLDSKTQFLKARAKSDNEIVLSDIDNNKVQTLSIEEARRLFNNNIKIERKKTEYAMAIPFAIIILIGLILQIKYILMPGIKARKLNNKLKVYDYSFKNHLFYKNAT